ncbi:hypothetical protein HFO91_30395 [Rhizobium leguminosarum]|uniref:hypothetical protein n=1 Tax=Rhizobium leguminosarum TaxID=384 RepID=UPI001C945054|nr:hypothetical protein [Rhizobium leguminosarum]MBY5453890.1 hypothetical protein [Rhizobium leguminosarum]
MLIYKQKIAAKQGDLQLNTYLYAVRHSKSWNATIWFGADEFYELAETAKQCGGIFHLSDDEFFDRIRTVAKRKHEIVFADKAEPVSWSPYIDSEEDRVSRQSAPLGSIPNHGLLTYQQCHDYLTQMYRNCIPLLQGYAGLMNKRKETMPLAVEMIEKAEESLSTAWKAVEDALAFSHFAGQQAELENPNHTARTLEPVKLATDPADVKPDLWEFGSEEAPAFSLPENQWGKRGFSRFRINEADKAQGMLTVHVAVHDAQFRRHQLAIYDRKPVPENAPELTWTANQWADHLIQVARLS